MQTAPSDPATLDPATPLHGNAPQAAPSPVGSLEAATTQAGLADLLRHATHALHGEAERSGVVAALLRGTADRTAYARYLAGLLPVYEALETALDTQRGDAALGPLADPAIRRAGAIDCDLGALAALGIPTPAPSREALACAGRIVRIARDEPLRLVAHAYTRYLGDLNGGRLLRKRIAATLGLPTTALAFHAFPQIEDLGAFTRAYRAAIDAAGRVAPDAIEAVIDEALQAFAANIAISIAAAVPDANGSA